MLNTLSIGADLGVSLASNGLIPESDLLVGAGGALGLAGLAGLFIRSVLQSQKQTSEQMTGWKIMQDSSEARFVLAEGHAKMYYERAVKAEAETAEAKSIAQKAQLDAAVAVARAVAAEQRANLCEQRLDTHWRYAHSQEPITEFEEFA